MRGRLATGAATPRIALARREGGVMRVTRVVAALATLGLAGSPLGCRDFARDPTGPNAMSASPVFAASTITTNQQVPFAQIVIVPCANNGAGEPVLISGTLHILQHQTVSDAGNVHVKVHFQPQGAGGVGLITGDAYRATGVTQEEFNINGPLPITDTFINNFRIIGQGPDNNLLVHQTIHITINANGELTAEVVNTSVECR
jgi:hypothetical protein